MSSNGCKETQQHIQLLRVLSIIAVVTIHTVDGFAGAIYIRPLVNFSVAMFLFLSGYLTHMNGMNWCMIYSRRITRVILPYVIWSVIYTAYRHSWTNFPVKLLTGQTCGIYYYIFVYIQITLLIPLLAKLAKSRIWYLGLLITPIAILLETLYACRGGYLIFPWNINNCLVWISYFYLGMLLGNETTLAHAVRDWLQREKKYWMPILLSIGYVLEVWEGLQWSAVGRVDLSTTQVKLSAMLNTVIILMTAYAWMISARSDKGPNGIVWNAGVVLGNCSFGIYLIHPLVIRVLGDWVPISMTHTFPMNWLITLCITTIIVIILRQICGRKAGRWIGVY